MLSSSMLFLGILCLVFIAKGGQASILRKYVATNHGNDIWPTFIYQTVAFNRKPFVSKFTSAHFPPINTQQSIC